jgi:uncharacterized membrane protein YkvA (DUF1232 family)
MEAFVRVWTPLFRSGNAQERETAPMTQPMTNAFRGGSKLLEPGTLGQLRLAWRLLRDKRVTTLKYAIPTLVALYVASPIDGIPDFLPGFGQMDDVGLAIAALLLAARLLPRLAPTHVVDEHLRDLGKGKAERGSGAPGSAIDAHFSVSNH